VDEIEVTPSVSYIFDKISPKEFGYRTFGGASNLYERHETKHLENDHYVLKVRINSVNKSNATASITVTSIYEEKEPATQLISVELPPPVKIDPPQEEGKFYFEGLIDASPEELGNTYLEYAKNNDIDINEKIFNVEVDSEFVIGPNTSIIPGVGVEQDLRDFIKDKSNGSRVPIILQYSRPYSVKEFTDLFIEGKIKFYGRTELGRSAFVTSVPIEKISYLEDLDYIKWSGLYKPSYKYHEVPNSDVKEPAVVSVLGKSNEAYKNDLDKLNIQVTVSDKTSYYVNINAEEYTKIANLLWVVSIGYLGNKVAIPLSSERADVYSDYNGNLETVVVSGISDQSILGLDYSNLVITGIVIVLVILLLYFVMKRVQISNSIKNLRIFISIILVSLVVILGINMFMSSEKKFFDQTNIYGRVCPWNDVETCKYGINNIVPLCDSISEVQEWKENNPAATLEHAYTLRKMTPEEVNDWFLDNEAYQDFFGVVKTDKVWWQVDYAWGEIKKCDNPPCSFAFIPEHPRFTVYIEEESKTCIPLGRIMG